jgi:hypothetical protein
MAGLEKASLGDGRGEVNGDAVEDFVLLKFCGTNPGGASGLTPSRGEEEIGVAPRGICQGAGDGRRKTVCRMGGGDVAFVVLSRYRHSTSKTAFSRELPTSVVSFLISSSNLSVLSSSSSVVSWRMGRQISYVASETIFARVFKILRLEYCARIKEMDLNERCDETTGFANCRRAAEEGARYSLQ